MSALEAAVLILKLIDLSRDAYNFLLDNYFWRRVDRIARLFFRGIIVWLLWRLLTVDNDGSHLKQETDQVQHELSKRLIWRVNSYEGTMEKQDVWDHRPNDRGEVADVQEGRSIPFNEEGYDRVPKKVEANKANIVEDDLNGVAWGRKLEGLVLSEDDERFKCCEDETKKA